MILTPAGDDREQDDGQGGEDDDEGHGSGSQFGGSVGGRFLEQEDDQPGAVDPFDEHRRPRLDRHAVLALGPPLLPVEADEAGVARARRGCRWSTVAWRPTHRLAPVELERRVPVEAVGEGAQDRGAGGGDQHERPATTDPPTRPGRRRRRRPPPHRRRGGGRRSRPPRSRPPRTRPPPPARSTATSQASSKSIAMLLAEPYQRGRLAEGRRHGSAIAFRDHAQPR